MNEYLAKAIEIYYKQFGLFKVAIKKTVSNSKHLCTTVNISHRRNENTRYGFYQKKFYDYIPTSEIKNILSEYAYDIRREEININDVLTEEGVIVVGTIELKKIKVKGHIETHYPLFIKPKNKWSTNFKEFIKNSNPVAIYKELSELKNIKISKSSVYKLTKKESV